MIKTVVIAGRDAAAWLSAHVLYQALGHTGLVIKVVELPSLVRHEDIYPSLPALEALHRLLGFDEHAVLGATGGAYAMGQSFVNFNGPNTTFFHPYGSHGVGLDSLPFLPFYLRARRASLKVAIEDFSLTAAAAKQGRFIVPDTETQLFARTDYGYHLPARAYVQYLKAAAMRANIAVHAATTLSVDSDAPGHIAAIVTGSGERIEGDLFIDASGAEALLLRKALQVPFDSWRSWFGADRVLAAAGPRLKTIPTFGQIRANAHGWLGLYAAQRATHVVNVYDSRLQDDDEALRNAAAVSGLTLGDAFVSPLAPGRSHQAWSGNCVAIGEAACVFDPTDSLALQAIQTGLVQLLSLFPNRPNGPESAAYNRLMQQTFEGMRDFQLSHAVLGRHDGAFWQKARAITPPPSLQAKLDLFTARGLVPLDDEDTFAGDSWEAVFLGHGLTPLSYEPLADAVPDADLMAHLKRVLGHIKTHVDDGHAHDAYLEIFCDPQTA